MTLIDYLKQDGVSAASLAKLAGTTGASITRIAVGKQMPSHGMIKAIVEATGGKVSAHDLVFGKSERAA